VAHDVVTTMASKRASFRSHYSTSLATIDSQSELDTVGTGERSSGGVVDTAATDGVTVASSTMTAGDAAAGGGQPTSRTPLLQRQIAVDETLPPSVVDVDLTTQLTTDVQPGQVSVP